MSELAQVANRYFKPVRARANWLDGGQLLKENCSSQAKFGMQRQLTPAKWQLESAIAIAIAFATAAGAASAACRRVQLMAMSKHDSANDIRYTAYDIRYMFFVLGHRPVSNAHSLSAVNPLKIVAATKCGTYTDTRAHVQFDICRAVSR